MSVAKGEGNDCIRFITNCETAGKAFSHDFGRKYVTVFRSRSRAWRLSGMGTEFSRHGHGSPELSIAFFPGGKLMASGVGFGPAARFAAVQSPLEHAVYGCVYGAYRRSVYAAGDPSLRVPHAGAALGANPHQHRLHDQQYAPAAGLHTPKQSAGGYGQRSTSWRSS